MVGVGSSMYPMAEITTCLHVCCVKLKIAKLPKAKPVLTGTEPAEIFCKPAGATVLHADEGHICMYNTHNHQASRVPRKAFVCTVPPFHGTTSSTSRFMRKS